MKKQILYSTLGILILSILYLGLRTLLGWFTPFNFWTARQDIEKGNIQIISVGLPSIPHIYQKVGQKYGFSYHYVGCNVTPALLNGSKYYNKVVEKHLRDKYGKDFWENVEREVDSLYAKDTLSKQLKEAYIANNETEYKEGDLIFQTSLSSQSKAIQLATQSQYSHCGLIFKEGNDFYVLEAVQPVKKTALNKWIAQGENGKYVVKRLKNANEILTTATLTKMKAIGNQFKGKNYDLTFEWSDDKLYCSELIWKIYQRATGIEIGKLQKLGEFDLTSEVVKRKMQERYGNQIPIEEDVISPKSIFDSPLLINVQSSK